VGDRDQNNCQAGLELDSGLGRKRVFECSTELGGEHFTVICKVGQGQKQSQVEPQGALLRKGMGVCWVCRTNLAFLSPLGTLGDCSRWG
jgi:hypothetical protein